jgi:hypothetical protein
MLALLATRRQGRIAYLLAAGAGLALALSVGTKFFGVLTAVPVAVVLLTRLPPPLAGEGRGGNASLKTPSPLEGEGRGGGWRSRFSLLAAAVLGGLGGAVLVLLPIVGALDAAYQQLLVSHLRAGELARRGFGYNLRLLLLRRELPLDLLGIAATGLALLRRDPAIIASLAWLVATFVAVLTYQPLFPHHLIVLAPPLALLAGIGMAQLRDLGTPAVIAGAVLLLGTSLAGAAVDAQEIRMALVPDVHDMEMTAAVRATGQPDDYWISDNPYAVAAADRNLPGPMVDTSRQLIASGLLTVEKLETTRARYDVKWVLSDSHRLEDLPGFHDWVTTHFRVVQRLGGDAVIYGR